MFNKGELDKKPERAKSKTGLPRNKNIERKLLHLSKIYSDDVITNSFLAYSDAILRKIETPDRPLLYFLSFDEISGAYGVFEKYLDYFNKEYGIKNNE